MEISSLRQMRTDWGEVRGGAMALRLGPTSLLFAAAKQNSNVYRIN
jgi:hypothetical protein